MDREKLADLLKQSQERKFIMGENLTEVGFNDQHDERLTSFAL
jgi:hypothetical protein